MAKGLSGELQCPTSVRLPVLRSLNYKAACEQAGTLFELTPTTFHFEITDRFTGAKKLILNDIPWQELTDATKIGVREGLWNTALVEVVDSGDAGEYHTMNHPDYILNRVDR